MKKRLYLWLALSAAAGLVLGIAWPPPPIPRAQAEAGEWLLPEASSLARHSNTDMTEVTRAMRWNGEAIGVTPGMRGNWRLAGFVNDPNPAALIMPQSTNATPARPAPPPRRPGGTQGASAAMPQAQRVVPGDLLPDGSKLVAIEGDTITTELDGCQLVYQLYRTTSTSAPTACPDTAPAAEPRKNE